MKNIQKNVKILIGVNLFFILISFFGQGGGAFVAVPLLALINVITSIAGFSKKDKKLGTAALILLFVGPIIGFSVCLSVLKLNLH